MLLQLQPMTKKNLYKAGIFVQKESSVDTKRIISLVPSQTELLYDLGLKDEVVGITKFCIHPRSMVIRISLQLLIKKRTEISILLPSMM